MLNKGEGFQRGGGGLLPYPRCQVVLHYRARPDGVLVIGEGLAGSAGGSGEMEGSFSFFFFLFFFFFFFFLKSCIRC